MNEIEELNIEKINIEDMIYEIRGVEVMLDSDLAKLYKCKNGTKEINQAVNRNLDKFPERFSWFLSDNEVNILRSQNLTANISNKSRTNPRVFTEQGVAMLATILKSKTAINVSINIMDAFVKMRKYISTNILEHQHYKNMLLSHDSRITLLEETFNKLNEKQKVNTIFYKGQIFDAYVVLKEILSKAKESIIIIDDYAGYKLFDILKTIDKEILIITSNIEEVDYEKYESQYHNIKIKKSNIFHDRFIIIDRKILYHSGASFKDLGKRCFAINLIEDKNIIKEIIKMIGE